MGKWMDLIEILFFHNKSLKLDFMRIIIYKENVFFLNNKEWILIREYVYKILLYNKLI